MPSQTERNSTEEVATIMGMVSTPKTQASTMKRIVRLRLLQERRSAFRRCWKNSSRHRGERDPRSVNDSFVFAMILYKPVQGKRREK